jgi:hypothetical protein
MGRDKDPTKELAKELKESLSKDEADQILAMIRAKKNMQQVRPNEASVGGNGQFEESSVKTFESTVPEQVKVVISQMLGRLSGELGYTILTSKVPNDILISSVIMKTRSERRNKVYRDAHPNESFNETLQKNLYLHLMAQGGRRVDDLLRIAELETDRGHEGNTPLSYGQ